MDIPGLPAASPYLRRIHGGQITVAANATPQMMLFYYLLRISARIHPSN
jgi:hypothetical protein